MQKMRFIIMIQILLSQCILLGQVIVQEERFEYTSYEQGLKSPSKVLYLNLSDQNLDSISHEILKFKNLIELDIGRNPNLNLQQAFLILGELKNLEELWLDEANIDSLPSEITKINSLKDIWLDDNHFEEFPKVLTKLENLEAVSLFSNKLRKIDIHEGELSNLKYINLCYNKFRIFPTSLKHAKNLERVIIWYNEIELIPKDIAEFYNLTELNLEGNNLKEIPYEMCKLQKLEKLILDKNSFTDESVINVLNITSLKELDLGSNKITNIPKEIGKLINLTNCDFSYNEIRELPAEFINLQRLEQLGLGKMKYLNWNQAFNILSQLKNLKRVGMFSIGVNHIPHGFEKLQQVEIFWLTFNSFDISEKERIKKLVPNAKITFN